MAINPPKPNLTFRVGIVGHRPNRLPKNTSVLEQKVSEILQEIKKEVNVFYENNKELFSKEEIIFKAISPLAEGTDRFFARKAIQLGYQLNCPFPFIKNEYEKDFHPDLALTENSLEEFRSILFDASDNLSVFEIDGCREKSSEAYGICGDVVLEQSDILIVVWDGKRQHKKGGTEETMRIAFAKGIPIILIDAFDPHICSSGNHPRILNHKTVDVLDIPFWINDVLNLFENTGEKSAEKKNRLELLKFYLEKKPKIDLGFIWNPFIKLFGEFKFVFPQLLVKDFESSLGNEWTRDDGDLFGNIRKMLRPIYAWPDKLSVLQAGYYRSTFIITFFLAAVAVGFALIPLAIGLNDISHSTEVLFVISELIVILISLSLYLRSRSRKWHSRWLNYRITAELIRHLKITSCVGGDSTLFKIPGYHTSYGHPGNSWMSWYVNAIKREVGLVNAKMDQSFLLEILIHIKEIVENQLLFHQKNAARNSKIENRLHKTGVVSLALTILAGSLHLTHLLSEIIPDRLSGLLIFLCGFLPALGATAAGIVNQGEFKRVERRSRAMSSQLENYLNLINDLQKEINSDYENESMFKKVKSLTYEITQLMVDEVLDWRIIFSDRPPILAT